MAAIKTRHAIKLKLPPYAYILVKSAYDCTANRKMDLSKPTAE